MVRTAIILVLCCASVRADDSAVVKINQKSSERSGAIIQNRAGNALILTCAHKLDEKEPVRVLVSRTVFVDGTVLHMDEKMDLALVKCQGIGGHVRPIVLADDLPPTGVEVLIAGYPHHHFQSNRTKYKGIRQGLRYDRWSQSEALQYEIPGSGGLSGAPVRYKGKLIGVHVAGNGPDQDGYAVTLETIREYLR